MLADDIREQMVSGQLVPGQPLPAEKTLMETYGVSRPTLREALRILEAESLIETRRGSKGGVVLRMPDPDVVIRQAAVLLQLSGATMRDVYVTRAALEREAVRTVAAKGRSVDVSSLQAIVEDGRACLGGDTSTFGAVAGRFHRQVVHLSGNVTMSFVVDMLASITDATYQRKVESLDPDAREASIRTALRSWSRLISLIEARDADGAYEQWSRHLAAVAPSADETVSIAADVIRS
jgi:DNA-binding FadR family transcriptional regulator